MGVWRTLKRVKFKKSGTNYTMLELKSHTENNNRHLFISIAEAYQAKSGEMKYKRSVSLPTKHLPKIIKALNTLSEAIDDEQ